MAILFKASGERKTVAPANAEDGFQLEELYRLLSCDLVQIVPLADDSLLVVDEEGKLKASTPPLNREATHLLQQSGGIPGDYVVGDALVCSRWELQ